MQKIYIWRNRKTGHVTQFGERRKTIRTNTVGLYTILIKYKMSRINRQCSKMQNITLFMDS